MSAIFAAMLPVLTSSAAVGLVVMAVWYGLHLLAQKKQWNDETWMGLVHATVIALQSAGVKGPDLLQKAEAEFEKQYLARHGVAPSNADLKDGALDVARMIGPIILPAVGKVISDSIVAKMTTPATVTPPVTGN